MNATARKMGRRTGKGGLMADIHVIFPESGGISVSSLHCVVLKGDQINWHIYCQNPQVDTVRIAFDKTQSEFFSNSTKQDLPPTAMQVPAAQQCLIWGIAPVHSQTRQRDDYTIYGYDKNGIEVEKLDPQIITDDPNRP